MQPDDNNNDEAPNTITLSWLLGWSYFFAWSASFYPQLVLNYKRESARGLSSDFMLLNLLGFTCLAAYDIAVMSIPRVKNDEVLRNRGEHVTLVHANDLAFAVHALVLTILCYIQSMQYGDAQPLTKTCKWGVATVTILIVFAGIETLSRNITWDPDASFWGHNGFTTLGFFQNVSFVKIGVTMIKYSPQLFFNYKRKSTEGWSIGNVLLDFIGGILSFLQLVVDALHDHDLSLITENPVKLALAIISLMYDTLFLLQHYVWFHKKGNKGITVADNTTATETDRLTTNTAVTGNSLAAA